MNVRTWPAAAILALGLAAPTPAAGDPAAAKKPEAYTFGLLKAMHPEAARAECAKWLAASGKADVITSPAFEAIWQGATGDEKGVLDRVVKSVELGSPEAAKVLAEARDPAAAAPKELPALFRDAKLPVFVRANLAVAFARALSAKRVYEEAADALAAFRPEDVADPGTYLFHRAVAEHALMQKPAATRTILRLMDDVPEAAERYKMVASLMFVDMQTWKDGKDLGNISRLMDNSERRLDLARGGKKTQDIQKKIIFRLDEVIKEMENQAKNGSGNSSGGGGQQARGCPEGGQPKPGNTNQPSSPQTDSMGGTNSGQGKIDEKKLQHYAEVWGKLPEKERVKAMADMTRGLPPRYREIIENYFKTLARAQP
jgi:hypothetical protein